MYLAQVGRGIAIPGGGYVDARAGDGLARVPAGDGLATSGDGELGVARAGLARRGVGWARAGLLKGWARAG